MEKSANIRIQEMKQKLFNVIVESQLPASIADLIVADVARQVHEESQAVYQQELQSYNRAQEQKQEGHK